MALIRIAEGASASENISAIVFHISSNSAAAIIGYEDASSFNVSAPTVSAKVNETKTLTVHVQSGASNNGYYGCNEAWEYSTDKETWTSAAANANVNISASQSAGIIYVR